MQYLKINMEYGAFKLSMKHNLGTRSEEQLF